MQPLTSHLTSWCFNQGSYGTGLEARFPSKPRSPSVLRSSVNCSPYLTVFETDSGIITRLPCGYLKSCVTNRLYVMNYGKAARVNLTDLHTHSHSHEAQLSHFHMSSSKGTSTKQNEGSVGAWMNALARISFQVAHRQGSSAQGSRG